MSKVFDKNLPGLAILRSCQLFLILGISEAVVRRCSVEKVFLEISQNLQENTCARVSFLIFN